MEDLYRSQAEGYDDFREHFLHHRGELVDLLAVGNGARVVELGAGTGRNLDFFGERVPAFGKVFLVDLCPPLLAVARRRCQERGWSNVEVLEGDAARWRPPDGSPADCVYFSYSLTMIPDWFRALDNALAFLRVGGILGVVDFHVSRKRPAPGHVRHRAPARAFWRWWFGHNDVFLSPDHVPYLESRLETLHLSEHFGRVPWLPFLKAPHYVFIGRKRPS
jgi:S-adenosylmethionine-diacylgycerolhomoserine-N-methlytransferase